METRICKECSIEKPLDLEHFHHHFGYKDGFLRICRDCYNARQKIAAKKRYQRIKKEILKEKE